MGVWGLKASFAAVCAACVVVAVPAVWAETPVAPRAAMSSDGFIRVVSYDDPRDEVGFRLPILAFAGKTLDAVSAAFELARTKVNEPGLVIYAMDGRTNDTRVLVQPESRKNGSKVVKIFLPSPGYSDLDELRTGVVRAFVGPELPDWVIQGILRCLDAETRRADQRFVLTLWSEGRLPFFPALCTDLRVAKGAAAALPGYLVGWMREKKLLAKFMAENYLENPVLFNNVRGMLGYTGTYKGRPVSVMGHGMGIPSIAIYTYELYNFYGVKTIIRIGSAGAYHKDLKIGDLVLAMGACTDSHYADQYQLPGTFAPIADYELLVKAVNTCKEKGDRYMVGNVMSADVFYSDNPQADKWMKMGVLAVEMEASALYMNAARSGNKALALFTISDHIITGEVTTAEERQTTFTKMMEVALSLV